MRKKLLEEKEKLAFLSTHGITLNREAIWQLEKRERALVLAVQKRLLSRPGSRSWGDFSSWRMLTIESSEQLSMTFGSRSGWKMVY